MRPTMGVRRVLCCVSLTQHNTLRNTLCNDKDMDGAILIWNVQDHEQVPVLWKECEVWILEMKVFPVMSIVH